MTEFTARREFDRGADHDHIQGLIRDLRDDLVAQAAVAGEELGARFEVSVLTPADLMANKRQVVEATARGRALAPKFPHPTVLVDFDGVLHRYSRGWHDGTVYDGPMDGAEHALQTMEDDGYTVVVFSTRDWEQIADAFDRWGWKQRPIVSRKVPAVAIIDDRAIRFEDWDDAVHQLRDFEPVTRRG